MDQFLPLERLNEILSAARRLRVGVVGDASLEGCWYAEAPVPPSLDDALRFPRPVVEERYGCGGAANVAKNFAALGVAAVRIFTVLGSDWRGALLTRELRAAGVDPSGIQVEPGWSTPFRGKILSAPDDARLEEDSSPAVHQEEARLDFVNKVELSVQGELSLLAKIESSLPEVDALAIVDFQPRGVVTPRIIEGLNRFAVENNRVVFTVDSRERIGEFQNMVRKPNEAEAARWLFPGSAPGTVGLEDFAKVALYPQVDCGCPLFITLGEQGCLVIDSGESHMVPAVPVPPPVDRAGVGDTFLAAVTAALASGANAVEAARLGHLTTAITMKVLGEKGSASAEEVLALAASLEAGRQPDRGE